MGKSCCFVGHRILGDVGELERRICDCAERLVKEEGVDAFYFWGRSQFDNLCRGVVTSLRVKYTDLKRILCGTESADNDFDGTFITKEMLRARSGSVVEKILGMIDKCDFCVLYCDPKYNLSNGYRPVLIAYKYAQLINKTIVMID